MPPKTHVFLMLTFGVFWCFLSIPTNKVHNFVEICSVLWNSFNLKLPKVYYIPKVVVIDDACGYVHFSWFTFINIRQHNTTDPFFRFKGKQILEWNLSLWTYY